MDVDANYLDHSFNSSMDLLPVVAPTEPADGVDPSQLEPAILDSLPHQTVLAQIKENDEGWVERIPEEIVYLEGYKDTLLVYWRIEASVRAVYTLCSDRRTKLVLCDEGVFEMNEAEDHIRFRGRNDKMETGDWLCSIADASVSEDSDTHRKKRKKKKEEDIGQAKSGEKCVRNMLRIMHS